MTGDALLKTTKLPGFSLAGLAIGNGWIDPKEQYPGYADFAYDKGLIQKGTPVRLLSATSEYTMLKLSSLTASGQYGEIPR